MWDRKGRLWCEIGRHYAAASGSPSIGRALQRNPLRDVPAGDDPRGAFRPDVGIRVRGRVGPFTKGGGPLVCNIGELL